MKERGRDKREVGKRAIEEEDWRGGEEGSEVVRLPARNRSPPTWIQEG